MEPAEHIDRQPNICGSESLFDEAIRGRGQAPVFWSHGPGDPFAGVARAYSIALRIHAPLIPAGGEDPRSARPISHPQYMEEQADIGDDHNALGTRLG